MAAAIAWSGGAAFVVSLGYFAFTYAVTLGTPASGRSGAATACLADIGLFLLFAVHHSVFARPGVRHRVRELVSPRLERSAFVWTASLLLITTCAAWQPLPGVLYHHAGFAAWPHLAAISAGVALTVLSTRLLDPLELAGIRQVQPRKPAADEGLVERFPYSFVRHPIYLSWVLMVFGVPTMTWSRLLMAALSTSYLVVAVPWEERLLLRQFGADYDDYRRRVRWRIVPFVY